MTDKMREEFEVWATKEGLPVIFLQSCGFYDAKATELTWQAWQASRAALVVELPKGDGDECGWVVSLADVEDSLDAAGVKYK